MYFRAVATDYDGTLAHERAVAPATLAALEACRREGRRLILVTGRQLESLRAVFPHYGVFDRIVAENGALLFNPTTQEERLVADAPPASFIARLKERGVTPLAFGRVIVATREPQDGAVREIIRALGLDLDISLNKGAVMVLPKGVDKATGLEAALDELGVPPQNVVAVGDAENDCSFMRLCGCAAAVANALPMVKEMADVLLAEENGRGVVELLDLLSRDEGRIVPR
jgi:phosphoglycolate phosphatase (TIGR01487 family)